MDCRGADVVARCSLFPKPVYNQKAVIDAETQTQTSNQVQGKYRDIGELACGPDHKERSDNRKAANKEREACGNQRSENKEQKQDHDWNRKGLCPNDVVLDGLVDCLGDSTEASNINIGPAIVPGVVIHDLGNDRGLRNIVLEIDQEIDHLAVLAL